MAMDTQAASAITRGAKRLKNIASDAVTIPSIEEIYKRKAEEIAAAKVQLANTVARVIEQEKIQQRSQRRGYPELMAAKVAQEQKVARLCNEAGIIKAQIIAARPKKPVLTPAEQMQAMHDSLKGFDPSDPHGKIKRGIGEQTTMGNSHDSN
jgi:hypothetical protein